MEEKRKKGIQTKKLNGYDLAFFRGKTHSEETKRKIIENSALSRIKRKIKTNSSYIEKIVSYGFELLSPINEHYLKFKCNKCDNIFERTVQAFYDSKYDSDNCQFCPVDKYSSKAQVEVFNFIKSLVPDNEIQWENRTIIAPKELDIFLPTFNLAIEYCGLYWHSSNHGIDKEYHKNKLLACQEKNIDLIQIFEDEWLIRKEIVKSIIASRLKKNTTIFARKCIVKDISSKEANKFLNNTHLMGAGKANKHIGAFYNDELVSVMTFSKSNISRKNGLIWEIDRFSNKLNTTVIGVASKIFKKFINDVNPEKIITYADARYGTGNIYQILGFEKISHTVPNYWYFKNNLKRYHRFSLRKTQTDPKDLNEWTLRQSQGWNRIYDAGSIKFIYSMK